MDSLNVVVHPLVLVNMADQWTRTRSQGATCKTMGCLLGTSSGRGIEVFSSFDLPLEDAGANLLQYFEDAVDRSKIVFAKWDVVGFYASTDNLEHTPVIPSFLPDDAKAELSLYLQINPTLAGRDLPISAHEVVIEAGGKVRWFQRGIRIESGEAERIAVGHVARVARSDSEGVLGAGLETHLTSMLAALDQLKRRIGIVRAYIEETQTSTTPPDPSILRLTSSLASRWKGWDANRLDGATEIIAGETLLVELLAVWTKQVGVLTETIERFNMVSGDKTRRRGGQVFM